MVLGAKVNALLEGRYNVAFEDVQEVAPASLRHRILLNFEGQAESISTDDVIADVLARVPAGA
jgi:MoxR-like ATPase